ncbi:cellulose synthase subunit BcsC-related outer membrane protein [Hylemonella gracilis]|uniref:Cellulose synthase domain-containing protein n=1 Tax=Hylemonella gracilis ATCC 19624 TaxID=887062 RepID=F3KQB4_9BURK|nr:cellulose synthase subunit BcsC-related outer membrane protein [Hylemonella gracilis]EGI78081.1 cellulose synthase domain-containing protein [Hylemonella gracilis ATCC 19624]
MRGTLSPAGWRIALVLALLCGVAGQAARAAPGEDPRAVQDAQEAQETHDALLAQARLWQERDRDDRAREVLAKLLRVFPDDPDGVAQLAYIERRAGQPQAARQGLERLRALSPEHPDIARLETLFRLDGVDQPRLAQARALARDGQPAQALAVLRELYPVGPPTGDLALEYWKIVADTELGWEPALAGLTRLITQYPDTPRYRLAWAEHVTKRRPDDADALQALRQLTLYPPLERSARAAWRRAMLRLPAAPANVQLVQAYLAQEQGEDSAVQEHLSGLRAAVERERALMADPAYRAGRRGLALVERDDPAQRDVAAALLLRSLAARPNDAEVIGGLGVLRMRQGRHAEAQAQLRRARERDPANGRWGELLAVSRYWGAMRDAGEAFDVRDDARAEARLNEALAVNAAEPAAWVLLGRLRSAQGRDADAERHWKQALVLTPDHAGATEALVTLYLRQGRERDARVLLSRLDRPPSELLAAVAAARANLYQEQAASALAQGRDDDAIRLLERAARDDADDPWLRLRLARLYAARGAADRGEALFKTLLSRPSRPLPPSHALSEAERVGVLHAYALYQSSLEQDAAALATLEGIAPARRDASILELQRRLQVRRIAREAALNPERAEADYRALLRDDPDQTEAALGLIELLVAGARQAEAQVLIDAQLDRVQQATPDQAADLIAALLALGDRERAWRVIQARSGQAPHARTLAYAARLAREEGRIAVAIDYQQRALAADPAPSAADQRTLSTLLERDTTWLSAGVDHRTSPGTSGVSRYEATELPLEWLWPQREEGRWAVRADLVRLDAGLFDWSRASTYERRLLGSSALCTSQADCDQAPDQHAEGLALNVGLERGDTRYDLGTTPIGFPVQSWVGGILHRGDLGPLGYSLDLSRRPVTGSVLSYAGAQDPRTGRTWGGVQATGVRLGLSLDDGGRYGAWSSLGLHRLSGRKVLDNDRLQLMAGGQMRVINEENRVLQIGLTGMVWHFSENSGEYTYGHGGYYSPEHYRSLALPLSYGERSERWSWLARASVSTSWSTTERAPYYPTDASLQDAAVASGINAYYDGGPSRGSGRSLAWSSEYQLSGHTFLGGLIELDRSPDYEANRFLVYLRHAYDRPAARAVFFPPRPFGPMSQD